MALADRSRPSVARSRDLVRSGQTQLTAMAPTTVQAQDTCGSVRVALPLARPAARLSSPSHPAPQVRRRETRLLTVNDPPQTAPVRLNRGATSIPVRVRRAAFTRSSTRPVTMPNSRASSRRVHRRSPPMPYYRCASSRSRAPSFSNASVPRSCKAKANGRPLSRRREGPSSR